jgi:hypothetical protein
MEMALQLGALRDALLDPGVKPQAAAKAAEEVALDKNKLTKLATMQQVMTGIGVLLLASHAALWMQVGKANGSVTRLNTAMTQVSCKLDEIARLVVHN